MSQPKFELRPYQIDAIQSLRDSLRAGKKRPVLMAATGSGKSVIAGTMVSAAVEKGLRVLFVVDNLELVDQITQTFETYGLKVAIVQGRHERTNYSRQVQVCMAQTLNNRLKNADKYGPDNYPVGLIVIDECHCQYRSHRLLAELYPKTPIIGLSATPFAKNMASLYDDLIVAVPMQTLIDTGYLCPFVVYAANAPDMKGVATKPNGDWTEGGAAERYTKTIHANVVKTWLELGQGRQTIGFGCTVAHARDLSREFQTAGINSEYISSYNTQQEGGQEDRDRIIREFKAGEITVLFNCAILTKGFDCPNVGCIIDARPTKSLQLHIQKIGRGLRVSDKQPDCIILDHAGNTERNGFPTDELPQELDDGTKKSSEGADRKPADEPLPKACKSCSYVKPVGVHKCPACGFEPEQPSDVEVIDGKLVKIDQGKRRATKEDKQDWYSQLLHVAKSRSYSHGWVAHNYRNRFDVWPKGLERESKEPSTAMLNYLTSQQIAFAKRRKASV